MDEQKIARVCKLIGRCLILASFLVLIGNYLGLFRVPDARVGEQRGIIVFLVVLGGIDVGCLFRWLGSFIEPKEPKER